MVSKRDVVFGIGTAIYFYVLIWLLSYTHEMTHVRIAEYYKASNISISYGTLFLPAETQYIPPASETEATTLDFLESQVDIVGYPLGAIQILLGSMMWFLVFLDYLKN